MLARAVESAIGAMLMQNLPSFKSQLKTDLFLSIQVVEPVLDLFMCGPDVTFVVDRA